jgi:hypothetical protein
LGLGKAIKLCTTFGLSGEHLIVVDVFRAVGLRADPNRAIHGHSRHRAASNQSNVDIVNKKPEDIRGIQIKKRILV